MPRVKRGIVSKKHHNKLIKLTKGYIGRRNNVYRISKQSIIKALQYSYLDRKKKKRFYRVKWTVCIKNFLNKYNFSYNKFIFYLNLNKIFINRKILYDIINNNYFDFLIILGKLFNFSI